MFDSVATPEEEAELLADGFAVEPLPYPPNVADQDGLNPVLDEEQREAAWGDLLNDLADEGYWPWSSIHVCPEGVFENTPEANRRRLSLLRAREGAAKRSYVTWPGR